MLNLKVIAFWVIPDHDQKHITAQNELRKSLTEQSVKVSYAENILKIDHQTVVLAGGKMLDCLLRDFAQLMVKAHHEQKPLQVILIKETIKGFENDFDLDEYKDFLKLLFEESNHAFFENTSVVSQAPIVLTVYDTVAAFEKNDPFQQWQPQIKTMKRVIQDKNSLDSLSQLLQSPFAYAAYYQFLKNTKINFDQSQNQELIEAYQRFAKSFSQPIRPRFFMFLSSYLSQQKINSLLEESPEKMVEVNIQYLRLIYRTLVKNTKRFSREAVWQNFVYILIASKKIFAIPELNQRIQSQSDFNIKIRAVIFALYRLSHQSGQNIDYMMAFRFPELVKVTVGDENLKSRKAFFRFLINLVDVASGQLAVKK